MEKICRWLIDLDDWYVDDDCIVKTDSGNKILFKLISFHVCFYFYKQPSSHGSKVKQLAKQTPTLKTLMQKILVGQ